MYTNLKQQQMKTKHKVKVVEILKRVIEVEADSLSDAIDICDEAVNNYLLKI